MVDKFREECGVFGIFGNSEAAKLTYLGLYALQHRGQESAGIASADGTQIRVSKAIPSRTAMMAMPCRPIGPLNNMASPGRARSGAGLNSRVRSPIPVVLMKRPSAFPRSTTLVSPATSGTPAAAALSPMLRTIRSSRGKPLLQHEAGGEVERPRAHHRHVVHSTVDRE